MEIVWEVLFLLQANFIVCLSGKGRDGGIAGWAVGIPPSPRGAWVPPGTTSSSTRPSRGTGTGAGWLQHVGSLKAAAGALFVRVCGWKWIESPSFIITPLLRLGVLFQALRSQGCRRFSLPMCGQSGHCLSRVSRGTAGVSH